MTTPYTKHVIGDTPRRPQKMNSLTRYKFEKPERSMCCAAKQKSRIYMGTKSQCRSANIGTSAANRKGCKAISVKSCKSL